MEIKYSEYYRSLPAEAQTLYRKKLQIQLENNQCVILPDPFSVDDWTDDPTKWPDVHFGDIYNFLIYTTGTYTHDHLAAFKSMEGYNFFESGHVQIVYSHQTSLSDNIIFMRAKVIPSQRVTQKPYETWICVENSGRVRCAHCRCMAGLGQVCVHVAAILFKVEAAVKHGFTKRSATSEACLWNKQFRKEIQMCPVSEMGKDLIRTNRKSAVVSVSASSKDPLPDKEILEALKQCCPDAVFFTLIPKLDADETDTAEEDESSDLMPLLTSIGNEISMPPVERSHDDVMKYYMEDCTQEKIEKLELTTRMQSSSVLWHLHRKGRITSTTVHDVLRHRAKMSAENLVCKIMGYKEVDLSHLEAVKWGKDNELIAFEKYKDYQQNHHRSLICRKTGLLVDRNEMYIGVSADGVVECECHGRGILEIKCPFKHKDTHPLTAAHNDKSFCLTNKGMLKTRHRYYSQVQLQMHVHSVKYCDFVIHTNVSQYVLRVHYDDDFAAEMIEKCRKFWFRHILPEIQTHKLLKDATRNCPSYVQSEVCICGKLPHGKMIKCYVDDCETIWFHYNCVGILEAPAGQWICETCRSSA